MSEAPNGHDFADIETQVGHKFRNRQLLRQAFVHRSFRNENPAYALSSNERLEFLGDAVLGFLVADSLYERFPDRSEGDLTQLRAALVRGETLARVGKALSLGQHVLLSRGEASSGGRKRTSLLARTFEALLGAVYLDAGMDVTRNFLLNRLEPELDRIIAEHAVQDFKSRLQEVAQGKLRLTPVYHTAAAEGPDHAKVFTVTVQVGDKVLGEGRGRSKQEAEQEAARRALDAWVSS